jgi:Cu+-exporting ATPase
MTCNRCVKHVDDALRGLPGVTAVEVDLAGEQARIAHDPEVSPVPGLIAAIEDAGYQASAG